MNKADEALAKYELARSAVHDDVAEDAARYKWILENPLHARHLLFLLAESGGQKADFTAMLDRVRAADRSTT